MKYTKEQVKKILPKIIADPDKYFKSWPFAFSTLCQFCEVYEFTMELCYHSGWFTSPDNPDKGPYLDKTRQGYTIEVGLTTFYNENGEVYHEKPITAVFDGLRLLQQKLEDSDGKEDED